MTDEDFLRRSFVSLEVDREFTEAMLSMGDGSRLHFCHRVGERWAQAAGAGDARGESTLAGQVLSRMALFRLNARHLDIHFEDGSRWEARFGESGKGR
jgi:hypothetical protein